MEFAGRLVAVGVGGMTVGVSVGAEIVDVDNMDCEGGGLEGWLVLTAGAPVVAQAASNRTMKPNNSIWNVLFINFSS